MKYVANEFNNYIVNVGPDVTQKISNRKAQTRLQISSQSCHLRTIDEEHMRTLVKQLKNKNSSGNDEIPNRTIKKTVEEIFQLLTYIINYSLKEETFLTNFKVTEILPIYKNGDSEIYSNYRLIANFHLSRNCLRWHVVSKL